MPYPDGWWTGLLLRSAQRLKPPFLLQRVMRSCVRAKRGLTLIGPISDILFDHIIGAGCVKRVQAAWVGNVITGVGYNFCRAVEQQRIDVEDHSNLTVSMALQAGAMGVSFMPSRTALGSDLFATNPGLKFVSCPFTGQKHTAIAAIVPDVAIVHVQRSDSFGNAHAWGNMGITREACLASRKVIITAEEIVSTEMITRDPNRILTPGFKVSAVVHAPWGAHPLPCPDIITEITRFFWITSRRAGHRSCLRYG